MLSSRNRDGSTPSRLVEVPQRGVVEKECVGASREGSYISLIKNFPPGEEKASIENNVKNNYSHYSCACRRKPEQSVRTMTERELEVARSRGVQQQLRIRIDVTCSCFTLCKYWSHPGRSIRLSDEMTTKG